MKITHTIKKFGVREYKKEEEEEGFVEHFRYTLGHFNLLFIKASRVILIELDYSRVAPRPSATKICHII